MALADIYTLTATQLSQYYDKHQQQPYDLLVLDVRNETFYRSSHIKGAINFPIETHCSGIEMVETMMKRVPWEYLFCEKIFYNIVLYSESTPLEGVVKEFFDYMLEKSDLGNNNTREWRRIYILDKGYSHFHTTFSKLCESALPQLCNPLTQSQQIEINRQLWVGDASPLENTDVNERLCRRDITSVIVLGHRCYINKNVIDLNRIRVIEVEEDVVANQFLSTLSELFRQIDDQQKSVYVCCRDGKTYSVALAIAYIMTEGNLSLLEVYCQMNSAVEGDLTIPSTVMYKLAQVEQIICSRRGEHVYPMIKCSLPPKTWILLEGRYEKVVLEVTRNRRSCHVM